MGHRHVSIEPEWLCLDDEGKYIFFPAVLRCLVCSVFVLFGDVACGFQTSLCSQDLLLLHVVALRAATVDHIIFYFWSSFECVLPLLAF